MNRYIIEKLKEGRTNAKLKQSEVAEMIGIKGNTLSNYENGVSEPDIDTFCALCEIYNIDPSNILNEAYGLSVQGEDFKIKPSEIEVAKKYRFISTHSPDGASVVDTVLDREYAIARQMLEKSKYIEGLKKHEPTERVDALTEVARYVTEDSNYVNAAHADDYSSAPDELKQQEEDIMDEENF